MTKQEKMAVFEAWLDGKMIQVQYEGGQTWYNEANPEWIFSDTRTFRIKPCRIKPEPREWWVDTGILSMSSIQGSRENKILVREVLP